MSPNRTSQLILPFERGALFAVAVALTLTACAVGADYHQFQATTPRPMAVKGWIYRPEGNGPFPAVILLHGSGGLYLYHHAWATWLRAEGYVAFLVDSLSAAHDVFAAATYLKTLPFVRADRIGVMGTSRGGTEAINAGNDQRHFPEIGLKALVALYPNCNMFSYKGSTPLLMLLGGRDDWTPAGPCQRIARHAREEGRPVYDVLYPDAYHGFDNPDLGARVHHTMSWGVPVTLAHDSQAHADSEKQIRRFLEEHLKR